MGKAKIDGSIFAIKDGDSNAYEKRYEVPGTGRYLYFYHGSYQCAGRIEDSSWDEKLHDHIEYYIESRAGHLVNAQELHRLGLFVLFVQQVCGYLPPIETSGASCTKCGTFNEYQTGPFICYGCRT